MIKTVAESIFLILFFLLLVFMDIFYHTEKLYIQVRKLLNMKGKVVGSIITLLVIIFIFQHIQRDPYALIDDPDDSCEKKEPGGPIESTCSDAKVDCHWQVHYCEVYFDYPTDCQELGPADPDVPYGSVSWENYYCSCDMKCHPKGECKNGTSDMINQKCAGKYGWPECPEDAFNCYWAGTNEQNVHCPIPKCCGGWCDLWDPC